MLDVRQPNDRLREQRKIVQMHAGDRDASDISRWQGIACESLARLPWLEAQNVCVGWQDRVKDGWTATPRQHVGLAALKTICVQPLSASTLPHKGSHSASLVCMGFFLMIFSSALRSATLSFLRAFSAPGAHVWQNLHSCCLEHPPERHAQAHGRQASRS